MKNKKVFVIILLVILLFGLLTNTCFGVSFEFNNVTYSIERDIPAFLKSFNGINFESYLLFYSFTDDIPVLNLICFNTNSDILVNRELLSDNSYKSYITFYSPSDLTTRLNINYFSIYLKENKTEWLYDLRTTRYTYQSNTKVILFCSKNLIFDESFYNYFDTNLTFNDIYRDIGITENGYTYVENLPVEITNKELYNIIFILNFTLTVVLLYMFLSHILRIRR